MFRYADKSGLRLTVRNSNFIAVRHLMGVKFR